MDFYHRSALILDSIDAKKGSVKGLCMAEAKRSRSSKEGEASRFLKVIVEVLKYRPHLTHLLNVTKLLSLEPKLFVAPVWAEHTAPLIKPGSAASATKALKASTAAKQVSSRKARLIPTPTALATIMVHDLLFAKRGITLPKDHKVRKKIEQYLPKLEAEKEKEKKKKKLSSDEGLQIALPEYISSALAGIGKGKKRETENGGEEEGVGNVRWLRVNTLKWSVEEAVEWFEDQRWELVEDVETLLAVSVTKSKVFCLDAHIEPLLALPFGVSLPSLQPYTDARLIAQDKASCMPAWVLLSSWLAEEDAQLQAQLEAAAAGEELPPVTEEEAELKREKKRKNGVKVIDATAAPGNKTTMAAALAGEDGRVVAVERDVGRYKVLKEMCAKAGCSTVAPMNVDFLSIDPADPKYKNVTHFLVDPSCSGSGIPNRLDFLLPDTPPEEAKGRIRALSNFQLTILSHAMRFSGARRVVYSTCSIWGQEDEGVVMRALNKKEFQDKGWSLAPRSEVVPTWERRGILEECNGDAVIADSVLRCLPEDGTNGFFVACFVRNPPEGVDVDAAATVAPDAPEEMSHSERQEAFKAKARAKGGKHAKTAPELPLQAGSRSAPKIKVIPMPSGGKTVVGNKSRIGGEKKVVTRVRLAKSEVLDKAGELTLEQKVLLKKRRGFEKLAGSVGASKRAAKE